MVFKKTYFGCLLVCNLFSVSFVHATASDISFADYLESLKTQALSQGVSSTTVDALFPKIKRFKKAQAIEEAHAQFQIKPQNLDEYYPTLVSETLVAQSRTLYAEHIDDFEQLGMQYGVQPRFVIALWGLTSALGQDVGDYPVLTVMVSNAYHHDNPAAREEIITALQFFEQRKLTFETLTSNGDGYIGYPHFSMSDYILYAIDGDADGKIDIQHNLADAFASTALFLKQSGWDDQSTWGRQVQVPESIDLEFVGLTVQKSFTQWQALGVRRFNGDDLPERDDIKASLLMPDGLAGRKYLVYDNYRAIAKWNSSPYYALSLTYLSERIKFPVINSHQ